MKYIFFSMLWITTNLWAGAGEAPALPKPADVFTITFEPTRYLAGTANQKSMYFTTPSLIQSLSTFQPIEDPHDARPLDMYQKGVIVLKNKTVLFWLACSADYFIIKKQDGTFWFYGRSK
jgi:hypothetical protein